jgi:ABC-type branched-subunit amino acid transport system substrate-binding protein
MRPDVADAEAPVARSLQLPVISTSTAGDAVRPARDRALFALGPSQADEGVAAALAARGLGFRRVLIEDDGRAFSRGVDAAFARAFAARGGRVARTARNADGVFYKGPPERAALLLVVGSAPVLLAARQRALMLHRGYEARAIPTPYVRIERAPPNTSNIPAAVETFRKRYGEMPSADALAGYDAMNLLCSAIANAIADGYSSDRLRLGTLRALRNPIAYSGSTRPAGAFVGVVVVCGRRGPTWPPEKPPPNILHAAAPRICPPQSVK